MQRKNNLPSLWSDIRLVIFNGRGSSTEIRKHYESAYDFWNKQWSDIFLEKRGIAKLTSDHFLRQAEIAVLFLESKPVAVFCYDWADLTSIANKNHSYFDPYPSAVLDKLLNLDISETMILSYLAVDEEFRKTSISPSAADIMIGLAVKRFENSKFDHIIGYARNPRKTNSILYDFGAIPVMKDQVAWGEPSDFIRFNRTYSISFANNNKHAPIIQKLWDGRIHEESKMELFQIPKTKGE